jgi:hypothetical protein
MLERRCARGGIKIKTLSDNESLKMIHSIDTNIDVKNHKTMNKDSYMSTPI